MEDRQGEDLAGTAATALTPYRARVEERRAAWRTTVTWTPPSPEDLEEVVVYGAYAMTAMHSRRRWLVRPRLVRVERWEESPGAVARDYLRLTYPRWSPEKWSLRWPRTWRMPIPWQPLYARPCAFTDGVYLDVVACWWTMLRRWGWGCLYVPGRYLGYAPPVAWPFADHKVARNALVAAAMPTRLRQWTPRAGYQEVVRMNPWLHIPLLHLISDVMHLLAAEAVAAGAVYVHTDGYIAPTPTVAERIQRALAAWGFATDVRARGAGWVRSVGSYRVGDLISGILARTARPLRAIRALEEGERRLLWWHLER